jgi:hypothetical protein
MGMLLRESFNKTHSLGPLTPIGGTPARLVK